MSVIIITKENFKSTVLENAKPVLLDFSATWCGPCQMLAPIIHEIANEHPEYAVCKIDVDEQPELAAAFNIVSIPTLITVKNGNVANKSVGYIPKEKILEMML